MRPNFIRKKPKACLVPVIENSFFEITLNTILLFSQFSPFSLNLVLCVVLIFSGQKKKKKKKELNVFSVSSLFSLFFQTKNSF